jgi:pimeloyl-ACP methyl ester carboxylesterase
LKRDILFKRGRQRGPLILFIHGLGMDKNFWADPIKSKLLQGKIPLGFLFAKAPSGLEENKKITLGRLPEIIESPFHDLVKEGFTVLAYSQQRPAADIEILIKELKEILNYYEKYTEQGILFITHSRGGLVARKAIEHLNIKCIAIVTVATPHGGSKIASFATHLSAITRLLNPFLQSKNQKLVVSKTVKNVVDLLHSKAIKELTPGSPFLNSLNDKALKRIKVMSIGGSNPTLFSLYKWHKNCKKYEEVFRIPDILTEHLPEAILPEEIIKGKGDSLVSIKSAEAPYADRHLNFHFNHASLVFHREVREAIKDFLGEVL